MSVDLPSSTDPAVAKRNNSITRVDSAPAFRPSGHASAASPSLEVALALAVFHAGFGDAVVGAGGAALGEPRRCDLEDDVLHRRRAPWPAPPPRRDDRPRTPRRTRAR